ncbi:hypothetical protein SEUCBS139899_003020 [Sporothrix eucalyptigena]|uniref:Uncharacterized protein n=1 Tax=Sporothrix eucalyptigena TaxID=1812306 RepID=A0ABP0CXQ3_9PEZI
MDHLIHLVQLNVYRAFLANMLSLGRTSLVTCTTDLDDKDGRVLSTVNTSPRMPPALAPTLLQKSTPHAAWIDLFPLPALRDALIRAHGTYDMCALYVDVLGTIGNKTARSDGTVYRQRLSESTSERTGVVVWGEPWRVESWELEEGFVRRWTWLLQNGCDELLRATDRWRQFRGDDMMDWADLGVAGQNALL